MGVAGVLAETCASATSRLTCLMDNDGPVGKRRYRKAELSTATRFES